LINPHWKYDNIINPFMVKIRASITVTGEKFSPAMFSRISSVRLVDVHEPGDLGTRGRFKGKPSPGGAGTIQVSDKAEKEWSRFDELLTTLEDCIDALREAGADHFSLFVSLFHDGQCNFGFSHVQLKRLAALNLDLPVSCYRDDV
jgi:hypothetical protein